MWAFIDGPYTFGQMNEWAGLSVPYEDGGNSILWASGPTRRVSTDAAASFGNVPGIGAVNASILGTSSKDDRLWSATERPDVNQCKWSIDSGVTWTSVPLVPLAFQTIASWTFWQGDSFRNALLGGSETGVNPGPNLVYSHDVGNASWEDKTGNLPSFGVNYVYQIDRDSMGSA